MKIQKVRQTHTQRETQISMKYETLS